MGDSEVLRVRPPCMGSERQNGPGAEEWEGPDIVEGLVGRTC